MLREAFWAGVCLHLPEMLLLRALVIVQEQSSQTLTADQATRIEDLCKEWLNAYELGQDYILTGKIIKEMVLKQIAW